MTPNLLLLYASSVSLMGVLALFARHNKKIGWTKPRVSFVEDLAQLQSYWDEAEQVVPNAPSKAEWAGLFHPATAPVRAQNSVTEIAQFTSQLSMLETALKQGVTPVTIGQSAETRETVSK